MNAMIAGIAATLLLGVVPSFAQTGGPLTVEVGDSTDPVPTRIQYQTTDSGIAVSGRVAKRGERRGRIRGHVHVTLVDDQGRAIAQHEAALDRFTPSRKNPDWASFSTRFDPLPAGVSGLRVDYHPCG